MTPSCLLISTHIRSRLLSLVGRRTHHVFNRRPLSGRSCNRVIGTGRFTHMHKLVSSSGIILKNTTHRASLGVRPAVLSNIAPSSTIVRRRVFNPVLPILAFRDLSRTRAFVASHPAPLTLCVFDRSHRIRQHFIHCIPFNNNYIGSAVVRLTADRVNFNNVNTDNVKRCRNHRDFSAFDRGGDVIGGTA